MHEQNRPPLAAVFAGGCVGVLVRAGLLEAIDPDPAAWPWPTFAVNVAGALLLGWLMARPLASDPTRAAWGAGFCGAVTTFSTLQVEVLDLAEHGRGGLAVLYAACSLAAGVAAVHVMRRTQGR